MREEKVRIRALTWNVHGFIGRRRQRTYDAIIEALRLMDGDIVALQEIDDRSDAWSEASAFEDIPSTLGRHSLSARTLRGHNGDYGHLLLSRWPMDDAALIDLAVKRREPRKAISCRIYSPGGPIRVIAAHLGLSWLERSSQVELIRRHIAEHREEAAFVLGDFNVWRRVGAVMRSLCPPFEMSATFPSYPSRRPLFALDRIACRLPLAPVEALAPVAWRSLSDHLPVIADLIFVE
jgi:endonuclease/exonuclease/phosphatase family metal-dependent hydrolase